jgi:hypothetical protein
MGGMRAARWTELLDDELLGLLFLVLAGRIVASFAAIAGQTYQISHRPSLLSVPILWPGEPTLSILRNQFYGMPVIHCMPRGRGNLQAHDGIRTRDLFLTKEVLYRLSYMGPIFIPWPAHRSPAARHDATLWSGKRDSNPRPRAWKARALPTELFPPIQAPKNSAIAATPSITGGEGRIRTSVGVRRQIYSLLPLATREPLRSENALGT